MVAVRRLPQRTAFSREVLVKPDSPLRAALYARVSTRDKGQEVYNQLMELRRFCATPKVG
jgi:predicted site-specific integrase-resolvase